jgi:hypothetical protein
MVIEHRKKASKEREKREIAIETETALIDPVTMIDLHDLATMAADALVTPTTAHPVARARGDHHREVQPVGIAALWINST